MVDRNQGMVDVELALQDATDGTGQHVLVRTGVNGATEYVFFIDSSFDLVYSKSTDSGKTWAAKVTIENTKSWLGVSVWYDRWTIGNTTSNTIHIYATERTNFEFIYFSLGTDDDLPEAVNNIVIDTDSTCFGGTLTGRVCACTAKNGDLFASYLANTHTFGRGYHFFRSDDSGATWSRATGAHDPQDELGSPNDHALLMPLDTDNDVLCIGQRGNTGSLIFFIWDNVALDWEKEVRFWHGETGSTGAQNGSNQISCAYNHDNADCYIGHVTTIGSNGSSMSMAFKFTESTRDIAWLDYAITGGILDGIDGGFYNSIVGNPVLIGMSRNQDTGQLFALGIVGDPLDKTVVTIQSSSDDGRTWSDPMLFLADQTIQNSFIDDVKRLSTPPFTDTASGLTWVSYNDDLNDLLSLKIPTKLYPAQTGNCKDNAGDNAVGVKVKMFMQPSTGDYKYNHEGNHFHVGSDITDASGNWSIFPLPTEYKYNLDDERNFYVTYEKNNGDIRTPVVMKIKLDTNDWGTLGLSTTELTFDTINEELDFDTTLVSDTNDQQIRFFTPYAVVQNYLMKWSMDFEVRIDALAQGSDPETNQFFVGLSNITGGPDASGGGFFLRLNVGSIQNEYDLVFLINDSPESEPAAATFAHTPKAETLYCRMGVKDKMIAAVQFYSDAARTILIEEQTVDITPLIASSSTNNISTVGRYLIIATDNHFNADSTIRGAIKNIRFYAEAIDDVVSADTGANIDEVDISYVQGQI